MIVAGLAIPLAITSYTYFASELGAALSVALLITAGILELVGSLLFRYNLLRVGVFSRLM